MESKERIKDLESLVVPELKNRNDQHEKMRRTHPGGHQRSSKQQKMKIRSHSSSGFRTNERRKHF